MSEKKYLDNEGLEILVAKLKEYINSSSDLINQYASIYNFPSTGDENKIYIDSSTNRTYRWDETSVKYYCVGSNYSDIDIIDGGFSN